MALFTVADLIASESTIYFRYRLANGKFGEFEFRLDVLRSFFQDQYKTIDLIDGEHTYTVAELNGAEILDIQYDKQMLIPDDYTLTGDQLVFQNYLDLEEGQYMRVKYRKGIPT